MIPTGLIAFSRMVTEVTVTLYSRKTVMNRTRTRWQLTELALIAAHFDECEKQDAPASTEASGWSLATDLMTYSKELTPLLWHKARDTKRGGEPAVFDSYAKIDLATFFAHGTNTVSGHSANHSIATSDTYRFLVRPYGSLIVKYGNADVLFGVPQCSTPRVTWGNDVIFWISSKVHSGTIRRTPIGISK